MNNKIIMNSTTTIEFDHEYEFDTFYDRFVNKLERIVNLKYFLNSCIDYIYGIEYDEDDDDFTGENMV